MAVLEMTPAVRKDLKTLAMFIRVYCQHKHADAPRTKVMLKNLDVPAIAGREIELCETCTKLLTHAWVKRSTCPMDPKPACKHCPNHCYHPTYRQMIREVMKFSGRKLVLSGRLDMLFKLFF